MWENLREKLNQHNRPLKSRTKLSKPAQSFVNSCDVNIPTEDLYAGTTIKWRDDAAVGPLNESITSGTGNWSLTYYLRTNTNHEGATVVGTSYGSGWEFTISATDSAGFMQVIGSLAQKH